MLDLLSDQDKKSFLNSLEDAYENDKDWKWEGFFNLPSGEKKWLQALGKPNEISKKSINGFFKHITLDKRTVEMFAEHDITEQKRTEELIRHSEAILRETQRLTHSGSWEADLTTGKNYWSDEAFRIFGFNPDNVGPDSLVFGKMIHPDDKELYKKVIENAIVNRLGSEFDLRIVLPDQQIKHIHAIGCPYINENFFLP